MGLCTTMGNLGWFFIGLKSGSMWTLPTVAHNMKYAEDGLIMAHQAMYDFISLFNHMLLLYVVSDLQIYLYFPVKD